MTSVHGSIGIDFGTTNTHFAYCNLNAGTASEPQIIPIYGSPLVPTCVLWKTPCKRDESLIIAIGSQAEAAWFELDEREKCEHRLAVNFKPDILSSEQARTDAWAFLRKACMSMIAGIAVVVAALIKGHVIVALVIFHPMLGLAALGATFLGGSVLNDWLKKKIATYNWEGASLWAMQKAISHSKINDALEAGASDLRTKLRSEINKNLGELDVLLVKQFDSVTDRVLEDFTVLEDFPDRAKCSIARK